MSRQQLLNRITDQIALADGKWQLTLLAVLNDCQKEIMQILREKEYWKREFYKQEERATRTEKDTLTPQDHFEKESHIGNVKLKF